MKNEDEEGVSEENLKECKNKIFNDFNFCEIRNEKLRLKENKKWDFLKDIPVDSYSQHFPYLSLSNQPIYQSHD